MAGCQCANQHVGPTAPVPRKRADDARSPSLLSLSSHNPSAAHPLDPLTAGEVAAAAAACRSQAAAAGITSLRFNAITLNEPPKRALVEFERHGGPKPPRQAFCVLQAMQASPPSMQVYEATIGLPAGGEPSVDGWVKARVCFGVFGGGGLLGCGLLGCVCVRCRCRCSLA